MTPAVTVRSTCRSCGSAGLQPFLDLGSQPLADALVAVGSSHPEPSFPLVAAFCDDCALVQILHEVSPEALFVDNYHYFSSYSDHLLGHARSFAERVIADRDLDERSLVVEIASNDGYLLRGFAEAGVPVLGIDPAPAQADAAEAAGIPTVRAFFDEQLARDLVAQGRRADVVVANNVMAHVPDLNGFVAGIATLLAPGGVVSVENPSVVELVDRRAFDTIYHEHHSYFSCTSVDALFSRHGLHLNDVEFFPELHGGTLRWWGGHDAAPTDAVRRHLDAEAAAGADRFAFYADFGSAVGRLTCDLVALVRRLRGEGATVAAYGAAAKGATLLNHAGLDARDIEFVVDRNPHKQGLLMPGSRIPVLDPSALAQRRPDYVLLLTWNFADEILAQQQPYRDAGGRFIVPVPEPRIV